MPETFIRVSLRGRKSVKDTFAKIEPDDFESDLGESSDDGDDDNF